MRPEYKQSGCGALTLLAFAVGLLIVLPSAAQYRSPGGISDMWGICALATLTLLGACSWTLVSLWQRPVWSRLVVYLATGIAIGSAILLVHFLQEQDAFDHWAHRGFSYFRLEASVPSSNHHHKP